MHPSLVNVGSVSQQVTDLSQANPQTIALTYRDQQLSYADLDRRADRFAGYLMQLGVAPGDTVAVCLERSFDWIVACLGIMRTGAAYAPLDDSWPDSRLRFAIDDSE